PGRRGPRTRGAYVHGTWVTKALLAFASPVCHGRAIAQTKPQRRAGASAPRWRPLGLCSWEPEAASPPTSTRWAHAGGTKGCTSSRHRAFAVRDAGGVGGRIRRKATGK